MTRARTGLHVIGSLPGRVSDQVARVGWLEDWRVAALLFALAGAIALTWAWYAVTTRRAERRPAHRLLRRTGLSVLVALTALAGTGIAVNSYAGYAPDVSALVRAVPSLLGQRDSGPGTAGVASDGSRYPARLLSLRLSDPADRIPSGRMWVYLPPGYADPANVHRRYPVAYLLHGYPSSSYDWFGAGRVSSTAGLLQQEGLLRPMILVSPDVSGGTQHDTECLDSSVGGPRLETFLTRTVVGTIDKRFRTLTDRGDRVLGGVSSGAFCTLNIGFRHQSEFGVLLALMPYGDPGANADQFMFHDDGPLVRANSPSSYAPTMRLIDRQYVFLAASKSDDESAASARSLGTVLAHRGIYTGLLLDPPAAHTWREARRQIPYALVFANQHLGAVTPQAAARIAPPTVPPVKQLAGARV